MKKGYYEACNFIKKETLVQVFPCEFAKFLGIPFSQNTFEQLLLCYSPESLQIY